MGDSQSVGGDTIGGNYAGGVTAAGGGVVGGAGASCRGADGASNVSASVRFDDTVSVTFIGAAATTAGATELPGNSGNSSKAAGTAAVPSAVSTQPRPTPSTTQVLAAASSIINTMVSPQRYLLYLSTKNIEGEAI